MRAKVPPIVWLIIGVTVSALAAPTVVAAATATLVKLQGVALTPAKQLTATETAPANFRQYSITSGAGIGGCQALTTLPTTSGLVVTELRVAWRQESAGAEVNFYAGASCAGTTDRFSCSRICGDRCYNRDDRDDADRPGVRPSLPTRRSR